MSSLIARGQKAEWTVQHLDQMVESFNKSIPGVVPIKLGHTTDKFITDIAKALDIPKEILAGEGGKGGAALGYIGSLEAQW